MAVDVCTQSSTGVSNSLISTLLQTLIAAQCAINPPELWPKNYGPIAQSYGLGTYDFVVIGAGTAGSVIASRLSENTHLNVLVLEAGHDPPEESMIPSLVLTLQHTDYTWNYFTENDGRTCQGNNNQVCYWPRGKMICGSGGVDFMDYVRGNRRDFNDWVQKGNPNWGWDDVLPFFEKSVAVGSSISDCRGGASVNPFYNDNQDIKQMVFEGAEEMGVYRLSTFEDGANIGYVNVEGTVKNGRRSCTGLSYLAKAKGRPNLHVIKNAFVTKIHFDETNNQATGVSFTYKDHIKMKVQIAKEVILSAGAIDSPKLLMLSGVGPEKHLRKHNIPLVKNHKVGDNLQDQVVVPLFFKISDRYIRRNTQQDQLDAMYTYLTNRSGPLSSTGTANVVGLINSDTTSNSPYPDIINLHVFAPSGTSNMDLWLNATTISDTIGDSIRAANEIDHILIVYVGVVRPKSTGKVRLRSADPRDPPKLFPKYLSHQEDVETLLRGIRFQMELQQTKAFQDQEARILKINLPECDRFWFESTDYWKCYMKFMTNTVYHLAGTVKMGPTTDSSAVLDWRLRVRGLSGLRVADASVMPNIVSANTNAATIMIAERAAQFIKEDWSSLYENCYL